MDDSMTGFLRNAHAHSLLHRQGRRRQDVARVRDGGHAGPGRARGCCWSARIRRRTSTRSWASGCPATPTAVPGRRRPVRAEHRPGSGREGVPRSGRRTVPRRASRRLPSTAWKSSCPAPARLRSPPSTNSPSCSAMPRRPPAIRPHHLRHSADRAHAAPAETCRRRGPDSSPTNTTGTSCLGPLAGLRNAESALRRQPAGAHRPVARPR